MDKLIPFSEIEKEINLQKILSCRHTSERVYILKNYLIRKLETVIDKNFIEIVEHLYDSPKEQSVIEIAKNLGYGQRQLLRIFKIHYGVSPKVLLNILRLHFCLTLLLEEKKEALRYCNYVWFL